MNRGGEFVSKELREYCNLSGMGGGEEKQNGHRDGSHHAARRRYAVGVLGRSDGDHYVYPQPLTFSGA